MRGNQNEERCKEEEGRGIAVVELTDDVLQSKRKANGVRVQSCDSFSVRVAVYGMKVSY